MQQDVIDEQTLRNTLRQLKVRDLSTLCGMVYVAKTGRKDLLICRIVDQYKVAVHARRAVHDYLRPMIRFRFPAPTFPSASAPVAVPASAAPMAAAPPLPSLPPPLPPPPLPLPEGYTLDCPCTSMGAWPQAPGYVQCAATRTVQHASCMGMAAGTTALGPATYRSPKVRLLAVDPFTHVEGYLEPPRTLSTRNCTRSQVMFTIPPNVMHLLSTGMHMLQLRCVCMQDPAPAQRWPPNVQLALNMKAMPAMQQARGPPPPGVYVPKVRDRPALITGGACMGQNRLVITHGMCPKTYVVGVCLVRPKQSEQVVAEVTAASTLAHAEARAVVVRAFHHDDEDGGIETTSMRLSLRCPLSFMRIRVPARGRSCTHVQCFDLDSFLRFNQSAAGSDWECPICHKRQMPGELLVDGFMQAVLEGAEEEVDAVELRPDASWAPAIDQAQEGASAAAGAGGAAGAAVGSVEPTAESGEATPASALKRKVEVISLDDSEEEAEDGGGGSGGGPSPTKAARLASHVPASDNLRQPAPPLPTLPPLPNLPTPPPPLPTLPPAISADLLAGKQHPRSMAALSALHTMPRDDPQLAALLALPTTPLRPALSSTSAAALAAPSAATAVPAALAASAAFASGATIDLVSESDEDGGVASSDGSNDDGDDSGEDSGGEYAEDDSQIDAWSRNRRRHSWLPSADEDEGEGEEEEEEEEDEDEHDSEEDDEVGAAASARGAGGTAAVASPPAPTAPVDPAAQAQAAWAAARYMAASVVPASAAAYYYAPRSQPVPAPAAFPFGSFSTSGTSAAGTSTAGIVLPIIPFPMSSSVTAFYPPFILNAPPGSALGAPPHR